MISILYMGKPRLMEAQFTYQCLASNPNILPYSMLESKWDQHCHFNRCENETKCYIIHVDGNAS